MTWQLDTAHSTIQFGVKHMLVATTRGKFTDYTVDAAIDETDVARSAATVTINAASIETGDSGRDGHLKSPDFFDVAKYPAITFASTGVSRSSATSYSVTGADLCAPRL